MIFAEKLTLSKGERRSHDPTQTINFSSGVDIWYWFGVWPNTTQNQETEFSNSGCGPIYISESSRAYRLYKAC